MTEDYTLESGVTIPSVQRGRDKYPFATMDVDDSFLIRFDDEDSKRIRRRAYAAASWANTHRAPKRFAVRTVDEGVRIWRTK